MGEDILAEVERYEVATTSINLHEILYGFYKVRKEILMELREFKIVDFTRQDALLSAKLEVDLELRGKPTGRFDAMIAAMCIHQSRCAALHVEQSAF